MEELLKCVFKCWKNDEFKTFRRIQASVFYDSERNWIVTKVGKSVKSSYKLSNVTDVQQAFWGAFLRHELVRVWVTDDDNNRFQFEYDGHDAPKAYVRIKALAESSSAMMRARPKLLALLSLNASVRLVNVLDCLPEREARRGLEAAREFVQHAIETEEVQGHLDGDTFVREGEPLQGHDASTVKSGS